MQNDLKELFKGKEYNVSICGEISSPQIFVVDRKEDEGGDIAFLSIDDFNVKSVKLDNSNRIRVGYYIFQEYSFKKERYYNGEMLGFQPLVSKDCYHHCECVLFPNDSEEDNKWILLIETKYAKDYGAASKRENDYPHCMIEQIISTAEYLRRHQVIPPNKMIDAVVAFPKLIVNYQSTLFKGNVYRENQKGLDVTALITNNSMSITQIARKYKIRIKAQNHAAIKSKVKISFS